jgi:hypothetical protein
MDQALACLSLDFWKDDLSGHPDETVFPGGKGRARSVNP